MNTLNERNMLFISHAWEDFEFTKWLALKLANEGFGVWCDLTKLLGGENWPKEINQAIQKRTCKFLFVLSKSSNTKPDPLGELETARKVMRREGIKDFIIPLKVDDISRDEVDYRLQEIQTISFESGRWANGLADLLTKMGEDKISKHLSFNPDTVNEWWKKYGTNSSKLLNNSEILSSNRFSIVDYPDAIYAHFVDVEPTIRGYISYPLVPYTKYILSFAEADNLQSEKGKVSRIIESFILSTKDILDGKDELIKDAKNGAYYFKRLLNQAFEKGLTKKNLKSFRLSKGSCYYFDKDVLNNGRIRFTNSSELNSRIKLWGKFQNESWHWAIRANAVIEPELHYLIQNHILVSNEKELRAAPKSVYKSWRNDKWRDKLRASIIHLSEDKQEISFDVGYCKSLKVSSDSIGYSSPFTYEEPAEQVATEEEMIDE